LRAFCDPAVHFGNEIFKDGNKLVVGHQPGHFDEDPAVVEKQFASWNWHHLYPPGKYLPLGRYCDQSGRVSVGLAPHFEHRSRCLISGTARSPGSPDMSTDA
jgi:hypothetical protein